MKSIKFLLFDDNAIILSGGKYSLESACNYVKTELCVKDDSEIAEEETPHLVITDFITPKMEGVEVCRNIKARYPNIEALLVSGSPDEIKKHLMDSLHSENRDSPQFKEEIKEGIDVNKPNCWEVKMCGKEPGGANIDQLGVCPVTTEQRLDGTHGGENAGRSCWVVASSMCDGKIQETYTEKYKDCMKCGFYMRVKSEENAKFKMTAVLLLKLQS